MNADNQLPLLKNSLEGGENRKIWYRATAECTIPPLAMFTSQPDQLCLATFDEQ